MCQPQHSPGWNVRNPDTYLECVNPDTYLECLNPTPIWNVGTMTLTWMECVNHYTYLECVNSDTYLECTPIHILHRNSQSGYPRLLWAEQIHQDNHRRSVHNSRDLTSRYPWVLAVVCRNLLKIMLIYRLHYCVKMMPAYPQIKDFAFQNVQKCSAVIIDHACDKKWLYIILFKSRISEIKYTQKLIQIWSFFSDYLWICKLFITLLLYINLKISPTSYSLN